MAMVIVTCETSARDRRRSAGADPGFLCWGLIFCNCGVGVLTEWVIYLSGFDAKLYFYNFYSNHYLLLIVKLK